MSPAQLAPAPTAIEVIAAALDRIEDPDTKSRIAFIVEEVVEAVVASAPRGRRQLRLKVVAQGGRLGRQDVTLGFQKHPPK